MLIECTVAYRSPEPAPGGYTENALVLFLDEGRVEWAIGERLDPATDLAALDTRVPAPRQPRSYPKGTMIVAGRPVRRLSPIVNAVTIRATSPVPCTVIRSRGHGTTRARRTRSSRQARVGGRDGPADESGGDGEGSPPPSTPDVADDRAGSASTSSQPTDSACPRWRVADYGIDTIAFGWYDVDATEKLRTIAFSGAIDEATGQRQRADYDGAHMRLSMPVAGITIGVYRARGLVTAEARAAAMLAGDTNDHGLAAPARVPEAAGRARAALASIGIHVSGPTIVRRLDLAGDLWFPGSQGTEYLYACQRGMHLPRLAQCAWNASGQSRLQSIAWQTPSGHATQLRMYDAGTRHGTTGPGQLLRVERQRRWHHPHTPTPEQIVASDLAVTFSEPMRAWLGAGRDITIMTPPAAIACVFEKARCGQLTPRQAEILGAKINSVAYGEDLLTPLKRRRRLRDLRDAGVAIDITGNPESRTVELRAPLATLTACWTGQS